MASFPKSYPIIRSGRIEQATVNDLDELIRLRTELAILSRFGRGATERVIETLAGMVDEADEAGEPPPKERDDLAESVQILRDAMHPTIAETRSAIDAEFPQAAAAVQLQTIHDEADEFHRTIADHLKASGATDAEEVVEAYLAASGTPYDQEPVEASPESGDQTVSDSASAPQEPVEAAAEAVETASEEMPEQSASAESVLTEAKAAAVPADTPMPEAEDAEEGAATDDAPESAEAVDDVDGLLDSLAQEAEGAGDAAVEASAEAPVDAVDEPTEEALVGDVVEDAIEAEQLAEDTSEVAEPGVEAGEADVVSEDAGDDAMDALDSLSDTDSAEVVAGPDETADDDLDGMLDALQQEASGVADGEGSAGQESTETEELTDEDLLDQADDEDVEPAVADMDETDDVLEATEAGIDEMLSAADAGVSEIANEIGSPEGPAPEHAEAAEQADVQDDTAPAAALAAEHDTVDEAIEDPDAKASSEPLESTADGAILDDVVEPIAAGTEDVETADAEGAGESYAEADADVTEREPTAETIEQAEPDTVAVATDTADATDDSEVPPEEGPDGTEPAETPSGETATEPEDDLEEAVAQAFSEGDGETEVDALDIPQVPEDANEFVQTVEADMSDEAALAAVEGTSGEQVDTAAFDEADLDDSEVEIAAAMERPEVEREANAQAADEAEADAAATSDWGAEIADLRRLLADGVSRLTTALDRIEAMAAESEATLREAKALREAARAARNEATAAMEAQRVYAEAQAQAEQFRQAAAEAEARAESARQQLDGLLAQESTDIPANREEGA